MKTQSAKDVLFFVWKAGLVIGVLSFGYLAIYHPSPGITPLALKYFANLVIISVCLYVVAKRADKKVKQASPKPPPVPEGSGNGGCGKSPQPPQT